MDQAAATVIAKDRIMELRRLYALATDLIGLGTEDAVARGRAIYHEIFTPDAAIGAANVPDVIGPDAWVDIVSDALTPYDSTQHLIGTQIVTDVQLPDADGVGSAKMVSYLQAWHSRPDNLVWLFIGTYQDTLIHTGEHGWQISAMLLEQVSGERRFLGNEESDDD